MRGEFVRGADPPLIYGAHTTAGHVWRAPTSLLLKLRLVTGVWKTGTKILGRLPTGQEIDFGGDFTETHRATRATSRPLEHV